MTDQIAGADTSVTTTAVGSHMDESSPGTNNLKETLSESGTTTSGSVPYVTDQIAMCHGFTPPGHMAELIFQASRLNSAAGSVVYHGLQGPVAVSHLGNLRTYQRHDETLNPASLVQLSSGGVIGLSPSVAHQNLKPDASHAAHPSGSQTVLGHLTDGTGQMMHVSPLAGRLVTAQNPVMADIENQIQDLSSTPAYNNNSAVSTDSAVNKISDPSSGIFGAVQPTTIVNYADMSAIGDNSTKTTSVALAPDLVKAGVQILPSSSFSNTLYPNLIVPESVAKGGTGTVSINCNYGNLAYLGLTLANTNASGHVPLTVAAGSIGNVTDAGAQQHLHGNIQMMAAGGQPNDLSKSSLATSKAASTSTYSSLLGSDGKVRMSTGNLVRTSAASVTSQIQCTTLDTLVSSTVLNTEGSGLGECQSSDHLTPGGLDARKRVETITGRPFAEGQLGLPQLELHECEPDTSLVSVEDVCQGLITAIVYLEEHPAVAVNHVETLRNILQHIIESDHKANIAKENTDQIKTEAGLESNQSDEKVEESCTLTQWMVANPYRCKICGKRFAQFQFLSDHLATHSGSSPWQCLTCGKAFADEDGLSTHKKLECQFLHQCDVCGRAFNKHNSLQQHFNFHGAIKPHACNMCGRCFGDSNNVNKHVTIHTGEKPYECPTCSRRFAQLSNLQIHAKFHTKEKPYGCPICNKFYAHSSDVRRHCLRIHGCRDPCPQENILAQCGLAAFGFSHMTKRRKTREGGRFACTTCDKRFHRAKDLQRHTRIHTGEKPYACNTCGKHFSDPSAIRVHNLIHTGERPHKCPICGKGFRQSSTLHTHMRLHSGERPFLCSLCGKSFATPGYLTHHMRYHGEKSYRCGVCGQGFVTPIDLQRHTVVHTGEKPYKCTICGKEFGWERNLKTHIKTHTTVGQ